MPMRNRLLLASLLFGACSWITKRSLGAVEPVTERRRLKVAARRGRFVAMITRRRHLLKEGVESAIHRVDVVRVLTKASTQSLVYDQR